MLLKLVTGFSFRREGLAFEKGIVQAVDDETGKILLATGKFVEHVEEEVKDAVEAVVSHVEPTKQPEAPAQQTAAPTAKATSARAADPTKDGSVSV